MNYVAKLDTMRVLREQEEWIIRSEELAEDFVEKTCDFVNLFAFLMRLYTWVLRGTKTVYQELTFIRGILAEGSPENFSTSDR